MNVFAVLVAVATSGASFGWQPSNDGSLEYVVQIETATAQNMLQNGDVVVSDIPSDVRGARRIVVRVSAEEAPHRTAGAAQSHRALAGANVSFGSQGATDGSLEYVVQVDSATLQNMVRTGDAVITDIPADVRGGRRVLVRVGSSDASRRTAGANASQLPLAATGDYTKYRRNVADTSDDNRRWVTPEFGATPDDPGFGRPPVEPYRPITPTLPTTNDLVDRTRFPTTNQLGSPNPNQGSLFGHNQNQPLEVPSQVHKPSITKADFNGGVQTPTVHPTAAIVSSEAVEEGPKPWMALTMTALMLFASLGGNLYLGWLARDYYLRYREMATGEPAGII